MADKKQNGSVKFFKEDSGYGFIKMDNGDDIFFHHKSFDGVLKAGERVEFEIAQTKKGETAINIIKL